MAAGSPQFRLARLGSDAVSPPYAGAYAAAPGSVRPIPRPRALLPSADALDYAHKLTSTTLLVVGAIVFLVVARRQPVRALRGLVDRQVAGLR
jgi:hypothetical protein